MGAHVTGCIIRARSMRNALVELPPRTPICLVNRNRYVSSIQRRFACFLVFWTQEGEDDDPTTRRGFDGLRNNGMTRGEVTAIRGYFSSQVREVSSPLPPSPSLRPSPGKSPPPSSFTSVSGIRVLRRAVVCSMSLVHGPVLYADGGGIALSIVGGGGCIFSRVSHLAKGRHLPHVTCPWAGFVRRQWRHCSIISSGGGGEGLYLACPLASCYRYVGILTSPPSITCMEAHSYNSPSIKKRNGHK